MSKPTKGSLIADHLKSRLAQAAAEIQALRTREVRKTDKRSGILEKAELCLLCGNADRPGSCTCTLSKSLKKVTPPDVSEKVVHKLKDEYGHDEEGKRKAFATAWKIHDEKANKAEAQFHQPAVKDCKLCGAKGQKVRQDGQLVTHAQPGKEKGLCNGIKMIKGEMGDESMQMAEEGLDKGVMSAVKRGVATAALAGGLMSGGAAHAQNSKPKTNASAKKPTKAAEEKPTYIDMSGPAEKESEFPSVTPKGSFKSEADPDAPGGENYRKEQAKPKAQKLKERKYSANACKGAPHCDLIRGHSGDHDDGLGTRTPQSIKHDDWGKSEACPTHGMDLKKCGPGCGSVKPVAKGEYDNYCPACGGEGHHIGTLGQRDHFMCRHCGTGFSSANHGTASGESKESLLFGDEPKPLHPSDKKKAKAKPVKKEEMVANTKVAPEKTLPGAKLPSDEGEKVFEAEGSGGQTSEKPDPAIKKSEKLQKDTARSMAGMEPWKAAGSMAAPKLPGMTAAKPKATVASIRAAAAMHPDTAASLAAVKGASPAASWKVQGLPGLKAKLATVAAVPIHAAAPAIPGRSLPAEGSRKPTPLSQPSDAANLAADKKAAGVGFLSNLITRFKGIGNKNWAKVGNGNANRIGVGAAALARSEKPMGLKVKNNMPKGPMTKAEAFGGDNGLGNCLHCRKIEHGGPCKPLAKEMMEAPTQGLSSVNHNHRLISLKR